MGACPFCKGEVDDDVLTFGGRCPSCLIEIPGDEAPTDPGAEARAAQEAAEAAAQKPRVGIIVGALVVGLTVVGGAFAALSPVEEPLPDVYSGAENYKKVSSQFLTINLDDEDDADTPEPPPEREPTRAPTAASGSKSTRTASAGASSAKSGAAGIPDTRNLPDNPLDADADAVALAEPTGSGSDTPYVPSAESSAGRETVEAGMMPSTTKRKAPDLLNADLDGGPSDKGPKGIELCGDQIRDAVKSLMKHMGTKLSSCGDRMLKKDDKFSSAVKVSIAIETTGKIAAIDLQPSATDDPEFLSCLEKTIKRTSFPRFCEGVDLTKTYYFGSQR